MKIFKVCKRHLIAHKTALIIYTSIILSTTAISMYLPMLIGGFIDVLIEAPNIEPVIRFSLIFAGLSIVRILLDYARTILYVKIQIKSGYSLMTNVVKHAQNLSLSFINKNDSAYLSQRINQDANTLIIFCITFFQNVVINILLLIIPFVILMRLSWIIAIFLAAFLIVYAVIFLAFRKPIYNADMNLKNSQNNFFSALFDQLKFAKQIKANSIYSHMLKKLDTSFNDVFNKSIWQQKVSYAYGGLDGVVTIIAQIILFIVGGIQILNGNFTIGMFTIFSAYFTMMLGACRFFFNMGATYVQTVVSYDRIMAIYQEPITNGNLIINDLSKIEIKDLSFSFGENNVFRNLNKTFQKGKVYCIAGENGAGKSTLINVILGLYSLEFEGDVKFDGNSISELNMLEFRSKISGIAEQEPVLISDSVLYNINFGISDKEELLKDLIKILKMEDFLDEQALEREINDKSSNISGGEKQKLSILRVLYKRPPLMIFDEPTSALDVQSTELFMNYILSVKEKHIIIIISHDKEIHALCDEVMQLSNPIV